MTTDLPLWQEVPRAPVEEARPLGLDRTCTRCSLSQRAGTICMPADGEPGGLLLVGEAPGRDEDVAGRPMVGVSGSYLRGLVRKHYVGPAAYTNALLCFLGEDKKGAEKHADACRGFLAQTIREVRPERVVALGSLAAYSLLGRSPPVLSVRRGYGWTTVADPIAPDGLRVVPVFLTVNPAAAKRNRVVARWFESDLRWALSAEVAPRFSGVAHVVQTAEDAAAAEAELRAAAWCVLDVESAGALYEPEFHLLCVGLCARGFDDAWVWDCTGPRSGPAWDALLRILRELRFVAHNAKFDYEAVWCDLGIQPTIAGDTMLWRSRLESHAVGKLEVAQELVGMGGAKAEIEEALRAGARSAKQVVGQIDGPQEMMFHEPVDPAVMRGVRDGWPDKQWSFATVPKPLLHRYNGRDATSTARLAELLEMRLAADPDAARVWRELDQPLVSTLAQVERWGVGASVDAIHAFALACDAKQRNLLTALSRYEINPNSPQQVADLLYNRLNLQCSRTTGTGLPSTDEAALEQLLEEHPVVGVLLEWRRIAKQRGTYADGGSRETPAEPFQLGCGGMAQWVRSDGRFHPNNRIDGTECLPAGELVLTNRGYLPVERVGVGDLVLTHEGRARRVTAAGPNGEAVVHRVTTVLGHVLRTSANHEYRTTDGGWVRADRLVPGDHVVVHSPPEEWAPVTGWLPETHVVGKRAALGWSIVSHVTEQGVERVYGLTVEEDHSHVTGGFVTHNSGRLSCDGPNLFNLSRPEPEEGKLTRDCFVASSGHVLVEVDQSQIELRVGADMSNDRKMIEIFQSGVDYHYRTAQLIAPLVWRMRPEDVPPEGKERSQAKTTNFAIIYRRGAMQLAGEIFKTARPTESQIREARRVIESILGEFDTFTAWCEGQIRLAHETGRVWNWWAGERMHCRWLLGIGDPDDERRGHAERQAINTPIQGTAALYTLYSLIAIVRWVLEEHIPAKVVLTVYDSILAEVREDYVDEYVYVAKALMEQWPTKNGVPLVADVKTGPAYGSLKKRR